MSKDASPTDIKKVFQSLARVWHPDRRPDKNDDGVFKVLKEAYGILSDTDRRRFYDTTGERFESFGLNYASRHQQHTSAAHTSTHTVSRFESRFVSGLTGC